MWRIESTVNTVRVSKKCVSDLFKIGKSLRMWGDIGSVASKDGELYFNPDHFEHMDYLNEEALLKVLLKHKAKGDICFGSLEGDNAGSYWGYRFDGKGGVVELVGEVAYTEVPKKLPLAKK